MPTGSDSIVESLRMATTFVCMDAVVLNGNDVFDTRDDEAGSTFDKVSDTFCSRMSVLVGTSWLAIVNINKIKKISQILCWSSLILKKIVATFS